MASPLLNTPVEIMDMILSHLSSDDLRAICLINKHLRALAEPFLYSIIEFIWSRNQTPTIIPLLRSLLRRPLLASFVRNLVLLGDDFETSLHHYRREVPKLPVAEMDLEEFAESIRETNVPYGDSWIQKLQAGEMDAFVALLLSRLPNMRGLYLGPNFTAKNQLVGPMFHSALCEDRKCRLPSFNHLRDVSSVYFTLGIDYRRFVTYRNTQDVLPLFYLPSVERISTLIDNPINFTWPAGNLPNPSGLKSLELLMIREGNLGQVLSVTTGLEKLAWEWYYRDDLMDHFVTDTFDFDLIAADLSHVRNTLTHLTISAFTDMARADPEFPRIYMKGNLHPFSQLHMLKDLKVPLPFVMGFSPAAWDTRHRTGALPKGLEYLTLTDDLYLQEEWEWEDADLLEALRLWLESWKISTPHLRRLHFLSEHMAHGEWGPDMRQQLRDFGAKAGLQAEMIKLTGEMPP
ncbi:predicted protein [Uncinocarpus reesii 1704]|uniref:F-box domain-containing protein n=1 Tax=Uncinocarpus reesii (strain UAMH 1704) TaxID=336963 RepID=C4JZ74_UNCRE|nr:uncharacterized protein UREG_07475 [Uncinocarpus reesii 1704]EEP82610.1 predicted protein [Uncinocarpus reesii 1704]